MSERFLKQMLFLMGIAGVVILVIDVGFTQHPSWQRFFDLIYFPYILVILLGLYRELKFCPGNSLRFRISRYLLIAGGLGFFMDALISGLALNHLLEVEQFVPAEIFIIVFAFIELSEWLFHFQRQRLHPATVFMISFMVMILIGALLLMLPKATTHGISPVNALFTSTSAVCVTGLAVLDTGKDFTRFGQWIILLLIQLGGLGVMTFTSLFGLLFRGNSSFQNRLALKDYINTDSIGDAYKILVRIIVITLLIELSGFLCILWSIRDLEMPLNDRLFFAVFHSISAFCNAGFSTLSNSLYEEGYRFNYFLHVVLAGLFILGGIGYSIMFNYLTYLKRRILNRIARLNRETTSGLPRPIISLNTKIVMLTTGLLIFLGTITFYIFEYNNTLAEHTGMGKWIAAFFGGVTPRTAGFNSVNTGALAFPTLMIYLLLMWIGASPGSTGGGIKTTTFAVATLNIVQQVTGKDAINLWWKSIPGIALRRASAIISLSLIAIGMSTFLIISKDSDLGLLPVAFETFSAYSTVGLSMGITAQFSDWSKLVLVATMFVGRVSFLTLLIGIFRLFTKPKLPSKFSYPQEDIFIN